MTTPDQHIEADPSSERLVSTAEAADYAPTAPAESVAVHGDSLNNQSDRGVDASQATVEPSSERPLFPSDELSSLRSRWDDVQAGFVDDPRACVQKADGLVSDVVEQLTTSFSAARAHLEEQWARGEEASTEDLRLALKRYREFFQKLLAV